MITESFHKCKEYTIRLRAVTCKGFGYSTIKYIPNKNSPNGIKTLYLKQKTFE